MFLTAAAAAPLDDDAIRRLIDRDALSREPYGDTCCGEGAITLTEVRWAELDGRAPAELVLTMQEYVGEGCATDHHHVYDVSGSSPRAVGTLSDGGYAVFPYLEVRDLDGDGAAELIAIGPNGGGGSRSTLAIHALVDGALTQRGPTTSLGEVYVPFDVDGDGDLELVALSDGEVAAVDARGLAVIGDPRRWLPALFQHAVGADLDRPTETMALLTSAMRSRGLSPPDPARAFDAALVRITTAADPLPVAESVWWPPTRRQRARLAALLHTEHEVAAATLALGAPGDHDAVLEWLTERIDDEGLAPDVVLRHLDAEGRAAVCDEVGRVLLGDGPADLRGDLSFDAVALHCTDVVASVLVGRGLPTQVVRGAIASVERHADDPEAAARLLAVRDEVAAPLVAYVQGADPILAAEAARAARHVGDHGDALRGVLAGARDPELVRSLLVGLDDMPPGPPDVYLARLGDTVDTALRRGLHGQIARTSDPAVASLALSSVNDAADYEAWHWRAVYRTDTVPEGVRAVLRDDAARRLGDAQPRVRQYAAQVLGAFGVGGHGAELRAIADGDAVDWVREAAAAALAPR